MEKKAYGYIAELNESVYATTSKPKELYIVNDAEHIDLYDRTDRIPFDKPEKFFKNIM